MANDMEIGHYRLDLNKQKLTFHGEDGTLRERKLSFREASILGLLIAANGGIIESKRLLMEYWGNDSIYNLNSLYVFMTRLKQILADDESLKIINARGIGYKLVQF